MSVLRLGATKKFSENWENIFGGKRMKSATPAKSANGKRKAASKKAAQAKRGKK